MLPLQNSTVGPLWSMMDNAQKRFLAEMKTFFSSNTCSLDDLVNDFDLKKDGGSLPTL